MTVLLEVEAPNKPPATGLFSFEELVFANKPPPDVEEDEAPNKPPEIKFWISQVMNGR